MKLPPPSPLRRLYRKAANLIMLGLCVLATVAAAGALFAVLFYLLVRGLPTLHLSTLTESATPMGTPGGGLRNAIVGSLILVTEASLIGIPLGIMGGLYQIEGRGRFAWTVRFFTDVLNSIPSIVIGLFIYLLVVIPVAQVHPGQGFSAFAGGLALGIMMIPTVMRTTEEIVRLVPIGLRDASLALGATQARTMWSVVLPAARGGIITGVMLAVARIAGETAPLLFTAFGNVGFSTRLDKPIDALPLSIFNDAISPYDYLHQNAMTGAIMLLLLVLTMSILTRLALRGKSLEGK